MQSCYPWMQLASCKDQHKTCERGFASFCSLCDAGALPAPKSLGLHLFVLKRSAAALPFPWKAKAACELWVVSRSFTAPAAREIVLCRLLPPLLPGATRMALGQSHPER